MLGRLYVDGKAATEDVALDFLGAFLVNDVLKLLKDSETTQLKGQHIVSIVQALQASTVNSAGAKKLLETLHGSEGDVAGLIETLGLAQISDPTALRAMVDEVLAVHTKEVEDFRGGNKKRRGFLMGQAMKASQGKANPKVLNQVLDQALSDK